jgi:hypothetical protein
MNALRLLLLCGLAAGLGAACSDRSAFSPEVDAGCTAGQQNSVVLEDSLRVTALFITREYTISDIRDNQAVNTTDYRVCQTFTCRVLRPDPAAPLTDAESADALAACRVEADSAWAYLRTL